MTDDRKYWSRMFIWASNSGGQRIIRVLGDVYLIFAMVNNDNAFLISVFYRLGIGYYYQ